MVAQYFVVFIVAAIAVAVAQASTASHGFVYFSFTLLEWNAMCVENRISVKEFQRFIWLFICFIAKKLHVGHAHLPSCHPACACAPNNASWHGQGISYGWARDEVVLNGIKTNVKNYPMVNTLMNTHSALGTTKGKLSSTRRSEFIPRPYFHNFKFIKAKLIVQWISNDGFSLRRRHRRFGPAREPAREHTRGMAFRWRHRDDSVMLMHDVKH